MKERVIGWLANKQSKARFGRILLVVSVLCFAFVPFVLSNLDLSISNFTENYSDSNISQEINLSEPEVSLVEPNIAAEENITETNLSEEINQTEETPVINATEPNISEEPEETIVEPILPDEPNVAQEQPNISEEVVPQPVEIALFDGSTAVKAVDNKTLIITKESKESLFTITSSSELHFVGNTSEALEWAYEEAGVELIQGEKELELIDEDYICEKDLTKTQTIAESGGMKVIAYSNPRCIYYPKQYLGNKVNDDDQDVNIRTIKQIDEMTFRIDFGDDYDPTYLNYSGNCNSTCYITAGIYNSTLQEGIVSALNYGEGKVNTSKDWADGFGQLYSNAWIMNLTTTDTECKLPTIFPDRININCNRSGGNNNWTFYLTYLHLKTVYSGGNYRTYSHFSPSTGYNQSWNGSINRTAAPYADWDSSTGSFAVSSPLDPYMLVITWNRTVQTDFDFGTAGWGVMAIGRNSEITSGIPIEVLYRVYRRNESTTNTTLMYTDIIQAFKNNPTYGDSTAPSISFVNPTPLNGSTTSGYVLVNVSLTSDNLTSFIYSVNATNYTFYGSKLLFWLQFDNITSMGENNTNFIDMSPYSRPIKTSHLKINTSDCRFGLCVKGTKASPVSNINVTSMNGTGFPQVEGTVSMWIKNNYSMIDDREWLLDYYDTSRKHFFMRAYRNGTSNFNAIQIAAQYEGGYLSYQTEVKYVLLDNDWNHIVLVYNLSKTTGQESLYINGVLRLNVNLSNSSWRPTQQKAMFLGQVNGSYDDLRVYNTSLSPEEVYMLYNYTSQFKRTDQNTYQFSSANYTPGTYRIKAYATDLQGSAETEQRQITITASAPAPPIIINYTYPTPSDNEIIASFSSYINVSVGSSSNTSAFIDWNRSLVGWWNFETILSDGTVYDNSSFNNTGFMLNFSVNTSTSGIRGSGLQFNGTDNQLKLTNSEFFNVDTNETRSMEAWFKGTNSSRNGYILWKEGGCLGWGIRLETDGDVRLHLNTGNTGCTNYTGYTITANNLDYNNNEWHHVAAIISRQGGYMELFIDGVSKGTTSIDNVKGAAGGIPKIGNSWDNLNAFNGTIDEVKIWARGLSREEINASLNAKTYLLYRNFSNLTSGNYTFRAYAVNKEGNISSTEQRQITLSPPFGTKINFTYPTPLSNQTNLSTFVYVNTTIDNSSNTSAFIDWNRTLVGWWSFENYSGTTIYDNSEYKNNATMVNNTVISDGARGHAVKLLGVNDTDFVTVPFNSQLNITGEMTIEAWVLPLANPTGDGRMIANMYNYNNNNERGWLLGDEYGSEDHIGFYIYDSSGTSKGVGRAGFFSNYTNSWVHVAGVYKPSEYLRLYINGNLTNQLTSGIYDHISTANKSFVIGKRSDTVQGEWAGSIDEVRYYSRALSPEEINASYNAKTFPLYHNFTNLTQGNYQFKAYAINQIGTMNATETRTVTIPPQVYNITYLNYTIDEYGNPPEQICFALRNGTICFDENGMVT